MRKDAGDASRIHRLSMQPLTGAFTAFHKSRAFPAKDRNVRLDDCPDQRVIYRRVFVRQLVSEIDDAPRSSDGRECSW